jgi:hypothetical protein
LFVGAERRQDAPAEAPRGESSTLPSRCSNSQDSSICNMLMGLIDIWELTAHPTYSIACIIDYNLSAGNSSFTRHIKCESYSPMHVCEVILTALLPMRNSGVSQSSAIFRSMTAYFLRMLGFLILMLPAFKSPL